MAKIMMDEETVNRPSPQELVVVVRDCAVISEQQRPAHGMQHDPISLGNSPKRPDRIVAEIRTLKIVAQNFGMQGVDCDGTQEFGRKAYRLVGSQQTLGVEPIERGLHTVSQ